MPTRTAEVAVVGAGVIGLAAADAHAQAGTDVVCFDPQALRPLLVCAGARTHELNGDPSTERSRRYVEQALPGLDPEPVAYRPCWLTILPWQADAFALWPAGPLLFFAGHNLFKLAPVPGRLLAAAARTGQIPVELTPLR